jgi:phosphohistidine swiveling domain-containing protein
MKYIYSLTDRTCTRLPIAGGKGARLSRLLSLNYNVPSGFVLSTGAFSDFLAENSLLPKIRRELAAINPAMPKTINRTAVNIQELINQADVPSKIVRQIDSALRAQPARMFAVRSSACFEDSKNYSWAGQFDSFLDVEKKDVTDAIRKCWASLFNARAIGYQTSAYKDVRHLRFAVVVQEMVQSDWSGVAFSVDPTGTDPMRMLIEAVPGRGDGLVSGRLRPFSAVLDKQTHAVTSSSLNKGGTESPADRHLRRLCQQTAELERHFKEPVDVEWAYRGNRLFLLQVRPITAGQKHALTRPTSPNIEDYELTFKVSGLSFLFTDMLARGFKYLDPLFTSDEDGNFCQYFTNRKMEYATRFGLEWFSTPSSFKQYQKMFSAQYDKDSTLLKDIIENRKLSKSSVGRFFSVLGGFLRHYSKMDNEFTDAAYCHREQNPAVAENLRLLAAFKDRARVWINNSVIDEDSQFARYCARLSNEFGVARADLDCYSMADIAGLFDGIRVPQKELERRRQSFCIYFASGQRTYLIGKDSVAFIRNANARNNIAIGSEIKGKVANRSQATVEGVATVINVDYARLDEMNKAIATMNKGDILIAEFTAPELLEACKKAKAIVTDIGGLLSHAAIVSRELGIPCLVGTGDATKRLSSGERISIDFESGIVSRADGVSTIRH